MKTRILMVDDHAVVRGGLRLMIEQTDDLMVAAEAASAHEALGLARLNEFDVALVDIALPDVSGMDLLKRLRAQYPKLAILMLSMYSENVYAVRALRQGAAGYLPKDTPPAALLAAIRKIAAGGKVVPVSLLDRLASEVGSRQKSGHEALSDRELEVLRMITAGQGLSEIAEALHLSPKTVTTYRARILEKTGLQSTAELVRYALEQGLLT